MRVVYLPMRLCQVAVWQQASEGLLVLSEEWEMERKMSLLSLLVSLLQMAGRGPLRPFLSCRVSQGVPVTADRMGSVQSLLSHVPHSPC